MSHELLRFALVSERASDLRRQHQVTLPSADEQQQDTDITLDLWREGYLRPLEAVLRTKRGREKVFTEMKQSRDSHPRAESPAILVVNYQIDRIVNEMLPQAIAAMQMRNSYLICGILDTAHGRTTTLSQIVQAEQASRSDEAELIARSQQQSEFWGANAPLVDQVQQGALLASRHRAYRDIYPEGPVVLLDEVVKSYAGEPNRIGQGGPRTWEEHMTPMVVTGAKMARDEFALLLPVGEMVFQARQR